MVYETQKKQIKERRELEKALEDQDFKQAVADRASYDHQSELSKEKWRRRQHAKQYARALEEQQEIKKMQEVA